jgi:hypothetical protein
MNLADCQMSERREPEWYRTEAGRLRKLADTEPDPELRYSRFRLAEAYLNLAAALDRFKYPLT